MPIPPTGWGAVEILIWDYYEILTELGHDVQIVNTRDFNKIKADVNDFSPDFIHIQYDEMFQLCDMFTCKNVAITSHFGYLDQLDKHPEYRHIHNGILSQKCKIFALSDSIKSVYIKDGYDPEKVRVIPNGVRDDLFQFNDVCVGPDYSIYLAKIDYRKRQYLFHEIPNLYFAGNIADNRYNGKNYLGEWDKQTLYKDLTKFANLVLLSDGEAHPLVCLEAMSAGLGLVLSEYATANLDTSLPFIDIIPENKITDTDYVNKIIKQNRKTSASMRKNIRQYVLDNFTWKHIVVSKYLKNI